MKTRNVPENKGQTSFQSSSSPVQRPKGPGFHPHLQGSAQRRAPSLVNFVPVVAYHFCLALPEAFKQPRDHLLTDPLLGLLFQIQI